MRTSCLMVYTILGIVSSILTIFLIWYKRRKPTSLDDLYKEEERKRQLRVLNNDLKTLSVDSSDTTDELNRVRASDSGCDSASIGQGDIPPKKQGE